MSIKPRFDEDGRVKRKRYRRFVVGLLVFAASGVWSSSAFAGTPKYPDLKTLPPSELRLGLIDTSEGESHYVVRFTTVTANLGEGPLELHGTPHVPHDGLFDATQWIYEDPAGVRQEPVGTFVYHEGHSHFHFDDFQRYELWSAREFDLANARNFRVGRPLTTSKKVGFCVQDFYAVASDAAPVGIYESCTPFLEGISKGWADEYGYFLDDQWIDVGRFPLPDGKYVVRNIADPNNAIHESPGAADRTRESHVANDASTRFSVVNGLLIAG